MTFVTQFFNIVSTTFLIFLPVNTAELLTEAFKLTFLLPKTGLLGLYVD